MTVDSDKRKKTCHKCGEKLDLSHFYLSRIRRNDWICKKCTQTAATEAIRRRRQRLKEEKAEQERSKSE
mgnify:CR=1 FL=1